MDARGLFVCVNRRLFHVQHLLLLLRLMGVRGLFVCVSRRLFHVQHELLLLRLMGVRGLCVSTEGYFMSSPA